MVVLKGEITDTFKGASFVLQMLTRLAKQEHMEYELLCISHSKLIFKSLNSFHFPTCAKSEL